MLIKKYNNKTEIWRQKYVKDMFKLTWDSKNIFIIKRWKNIINKYRWIWHKYNKHN